MYLIFRCYDDFGGGGKEPLFITENEQTAEDFCSNPRNEDFVEKDTYFVSAEQIEFGYYDNHYVGYAYMEINNFPDFCKT